MAPSGCISTGPCCGGDDSSIEGGNDWGRRIDNVFDTSTDAEIAREMNQLSFKEREKVYDDIHGVMSDDKHQTETPNFVTKCLEEFDGAIPKIPKRKRRAIDKAYFLRPSLATDQAFKLKFLRADRYDATKAAQRMVKFFEWKSELFGEDKIVTDITLDELGEKDVEVSVLSGCCLVLPRTDHSGRPIITFDISKFDHSYVPELLRFNWYMSYTALEGEAAQTKGVAALNYAPTKRHYPSPPMKEEMDSVSRSGRMLESLPLRVTAYHFCTDDPKMRFLLNMVRLTHARDVRVRMRTHYGSDLEMEYALMTFGIQCKGFLSSHKPEATPLSYAYLQIRREKEARLKAKKLEDEKRTGMVLYPEPTDVLIGRGRPYHLYPGTRRLLDLIELRIDEYYGPTSDRFLKTCINMEITRKIEQTGGRFLTRNKTGWNVLNEVLAREKTANLFRYRFNLKNGGSSAKMATNPSQPTTTHLSALAHLNTKKRSRDGIDSNGRPAKLNDFEVGPNKFPLLG